MANEGKNRIDERLNWRSIFSAYIANGNGEFNLTIEKRSAQIKITVNISAYTV